MDLRLLTRGGAVAALIGTLGYAGLSALHGNPPIEDPAATLEFVAARAWWRAAHYGTIAALLLWLGAFGAVTRLLAPGDRGGLGRFALGVATCAAAVFAVYYSLHGFGLPALAQRWTAAPGPEVLTETRAVLTVLGSTAFTAQALLGLTVLLYGLAMALGRGLPRWLGWAGAVAGLGWLSGALLVDFAVIVPFTVAAWAWMITTGVALWRQGESVSARSGTPPCAADGPRSAGRRATR
ncbi:hypothetical protein [Crossiella sp. NPDC003009]